MSSPSFREVTRCRACAGTALEPFLDLGATPLANSFVAPERAGSPEPRYPLQTVRCRSCGLVQLSVVVRPELMFGEYAYASSASHPLLAHFAGLAEEICARYATPGDLVVEIGSNDGVLLRPLAARGASVLGIEPAANIAALANAAGLETRVAFFGSATATAVAAEKGRAKVVVGNNVLAHIDDLADVLIALDALLAADGVLVAEVPYLGDLLERVEYDTIYHEHLSYFSVEPLARLFAEGGFDLFDVQHLPIHGGSIRIHVGRRGRNAGTPRLTQARVAEDAARLGDTATYRRFAERVGESREALVALLDDLRGRGRSVAGHGASAKGNTLLNYCGIGPDRIAFIGDSTPFKQGMLTPGMHIPVRPEESIVVERPDFAVLLAWNYADAIVAKHAAYRAAGGRFIHPIPLAREYP